jgi:hypothetical protein
VRRERVAAERIVCGRRGLWMVSGVVETRAGRRTSHPVLSW